MEETDYCVVLNTCPNRTTGEQIARQLVEQRLAACVNLVDRITSIYRWEDGIEEEQETLLIIKTEKTCYPSLEKTLQELHPYEVPEIIQLPITNGSTSYLEWIHQNTYKTR